jgi:hypothetical protein
MLRQVTWRSWAALAIALGTYVGLGFWLSSSGTAEELLYKWGLLALTVTPLLLTAIYTFTGNRWWANDIGSALVVLALGITWTAWPLAYTFWFLHGMLTVSWLAWIEVSGPALVSLAILRLCYVFARIHRDGRGSNKEGAS